MDSNLPKNFPGKQAAAPGNGGALPKNFAAARADAAPAAAHATGGAPEVTRGEIADHFATRIVALRDAARGASTRPWLFVVEIPYADFELDIAHAYARGTGATLHPGGSMPTSATPTEALAMLGSSISGPGDIERFVHYLNFGHDVTILCPKAWMLPRQALDLVDATLPLPRFDRAGFAAACMDFYELPVPPAIDEPAEWTGNVVPRDFLMNAQRGAEADVIAALRRTVERRLARCAPGDAFALEDLCGLEEARDWALGLVAEIGAARAGTLAWTDVESRVVLTGRRGVGKTSLTRAIAKAADLRFVETSATAWLPSDQDGSLALARLRADFDEALAAAPTVFFIDDIDVFATPAFAPLVGYFLKFLQSLTGEDRVIVIAGAQSSEHVRFELRRHGGLESMLAMPAPSSSVLARIYQLMLKDVPHALSSADLDGLGRLSLGLDGHDLELIVRRARRRARKRGQQPVTKDDITRVLIQERYGGAQSESQRRLMAEEELRNTAYHEAGHALLQLMCTRSAGLRYASIVPRESGTLGFVLPGIDESRNSVTRRDIVECIRVALAGRAAEEVLGGKESVTTGCSNDLEKATHYVHVLLTRAGFESLLSLRRRFETSPDLRAQAEAILAEEYRYVVELLQRHRAFLDQVAALLIERQEVPGDDLMRLYGEYRAQNPAA